MPESFLATTMASADAAVIDIGSNSVRLVLYRLEGRAIWTVFNEKVLAGLGRDLPRTGRLSEEGVAMALPALRRFAAVIEGVRPQHVFVAATAAVREAGDGVTFCERVARTRLAMPPGACWPAIRRPKASRPTWAAPVWN